jgi:cytoskeletal protein CcmA (bactofilin family)
VLRRAWLLTALLSAALALPATAGAVTTTGTGTGDRGDAVVVLNGAVTVARGETVEGVYVANGDVRIAGRVDGDVVALAGDVLVAGRVDGSLFTASGRTRLLPGAEVTDDVRYGDERPQIAAGARVGGEVEKRGWPDFGGLLPLIGGFLVWLAIGLSSFVLGALLLLIAPRAADALEARSRERVGPLIAIGIAILIAVPVAALLAAITLVGLPLAIGLGLALLPGAAVAYVVAAYALGRRLVRAPRGRLLSFLAGLAILRLLALVPILGALVGLAAVVFGLGLIGAAIGAARQPGEPAPVRTPDS